MQLYCQKKISIEFIIEGINFPLIHATESTIFIIDRICALKYNDTSSTSSF